MAHELNQRCAECELLLIRKITVELLPDQENFVESHLAQCAACNDELEKLSRLWQGMESLPSGAIPPKLHDETQKALIGLLRQERRFFYRLVGDSLKGASSYILPFLTGLVMTALCYALMADLINHRVHHHHIVISVFAFWGVLFVFASWLMFRRKVGRVSSLSVVIAVSLSITFLTLLLARLFSLNEVLSWIYGSWLDEFLTRYLPEVGHRIVISWESYVCAAAFVGALLFGLQNGNYVSKVAIMASLLVTFLIIPAVYLQGSFHDHGYGIIFLGALGTFFGSSLGIVLGSTVRRQLLFSLT